MAVRTTGRATGRATGGPAGAGTGGRALTSRYAGLVLLVGAATCLGGCSGPGVHRLGVVGWPAVPGQLVALWPLAVVSRP